MDSSQVGDVRFARDFLEKLYDAVNRHDAEAIAALCTEDIHWEDPVTVPQ
jgi:ketosteroid isomerase-like protein